MNALQAYEERVLAEGIGQQWGEGLRNGALVGVLIGFLASWGVCVLGALR